jgi:hypothetical protein
MNARRIGWANPWVLLALSILGIGAAWLTTWGNWAFFAWEPMGTLADAQANRLWSAGRWDVPAHITHVETFLVDGKAYMYFGPGPAFLRWLTYALGPAAPGTWSRAMVWLAGMGSLAMTVSLIQWMARVRAAEGVRRQPGRTWVAVFLLLLASGSTLPFLLSRAFVYHEAIVAGSAWTLAALVALAIHLRSPAAASLVAVGGLGTMAALTRVPGGAGVAGVLFVMGILLAARPAARTGIGRLTHWLGLPDYEGSRLHGLLALAMGALIIGSVGYVNYAKFGDPTESVPIRYHVSYVEEGRADQLEGSLVHLGNIPRNLYSYLHPGHILIDETFPWIYPTLESGLPLPAGQKEPPPGLGRPSRRARIYIDPQWIADSPFPWTRADFVERYASATASMPAVLLLGLIGFVSLWGRTGGVGAYLRLPMLGGLAAGLPFLMSAGISHRFLHDAFPAAALACVIGLFTVSDLRSGPAKKALVGLLLVLGLWGSAANVAFGVGYQRIYSWGVPPALQFDFLLTQQKVDRWVEKTLGITIEADWSTGDEP